MSLTLQINLPREVEDLLRREDPDLDRTATEALLVSLYRRGKLTHHQLAQSLGLDRFQTEELLHAHNVTEDLGTVEDYLMEAHAIEKLRAKGG